MWCLLPCLYESVWFCSSDPLHLASFTTSPWPKAFISLQAQMLACGCLNVSVWFCPPYPVHLASFTISPWPKALSVYNPRSWLVDVWMSLCDSVLQILSISPWPKALSVHNPRCWLGDVWMSLCDSVLQALCFFHHFSKAKDFTGL